MKASSSKGGRVSSEGEMCVCSFLYPSPCIYRREPPRDRSSSLQNQHWEPVREHHVAKLRRWGPWAWSADHRPPSGPIDLPFRSTGSFLGPHVIGTGIGSCTVGFLLWWPSIPYSDMCRILIDGTLCPGSNHTIILQNRLEITCGIR